MKPSTDTCNAAMIFLMKVILDASRSNLSTVLSLCRHAYGGRWSFGDVRLNIF